MDKKLFLLAIIPVVILIYFSFGFDDVNEKDDFKIIDAHEHVQDFERGLNLLQAMENNGIKQVWLMGSPEATIYINREGFGGYDVNNEELLKLVEAYPDRFVAFCTVKPEDPEKLNKFKSCIERGGKGLKLYTGHSMFYTLPLDDPVMDEIYSYVEENRIPIMFHVNAGKYVEEFENVLKKYPDMKVICPHFCLSSIRISRLQRLLDTYENLYTDISFGAFAMEGLERISKDTEKYKDFINSYSDRVLFGSDMVVTNNPIKTVEWLTGKSKCYVDLLENGEYICSLAPDKTLNGLDLSNEVLRKIYIENPKKIFS